MDATNRQFDERLISRYFEASAADLVRDEFSNKPRDASLGLGFNAANANPMSLFRLLNIQARKNQEEIKQSFIEGG